MQANADLARQRASITSAMLGAKYQGKKEIF
jgi:hypothetical protein